MAKTIDADLLQKERDELEKKLIQARQNLSVLTQVQFQI